MRIPRSALWFAGGIVLTALVGAVAAQTNYLGVVFLADPTTPSRQMTVNADGSINVETGSGTPIPVVPSPVAYTKTIITLAAATSATLLSASSAYKAVCFMNIGATNPFTFTDGAAAAVVGQGEAINPASAVGNQGSEYCYPAPPTNAVQGISTGGTTVVVKVGQ